jgi:hypothetical protein
VVQVQANLLMETEWPARSLTSMEYAVSGLPQERAPVILVWPLGGRQNQEQPKNHE